MNAQIRIWIIVLLLISLSAASQEFNFKNFDVYKGLSHNTVHCAVKDSIGMMWFGTKNGISRYDGVSFKLFKNSAQNPYSIGSNFIVCLDFKDDMLWVGTDSGLFWFDIKLERFFLLEVTKEKPIIDIQNDDKGNLWYITNGILHKYVKKTGETIVFPPRQYFNAGEITKTPDGDIWVASSGSLHKFNERSLSFENYILDPVIENDLSFNITKIYTLNENAILIGTDNHGAYVFDITTYDLTKLFQTNNERIYVRDFLKKQNDIWVGTESGIFIHNIFSGVTKRLKKDYNNPFSISDNAIYCLIEDDQEGTWVGTYFGGLNYLPYQSTPFNKYFPKIGENSISGNAVREIKKDAFGNIWIGTEDNGLNKYNSETEHFSSIELKDLQNGLIRKNIHAVLPLGDKIWVSTFRGGLFVIDAVSGKTLKQYKAGKKSGLRSNFIYKLYQSKDKRIFAITSLGIYVFSFEYDRFTLFNKFPENVFYTSFLEDSNGGIWAGTYWDGIFYYNPSTNTNNIYKKSESELNTLSSNAINEIFEDSEKRIWVTTEKGLNLIDQETMTFNSFDSEDGFPSDVFYSIIEDVENSLWSSTANGLVNFHQKLMRKKSIPLKMVF